MKDLTIINSEIRVRALRGQVWTTKIAGLVRFIQRAGLNHAMKMAIMERNEVTECLL